jgi:plastocyanin
MPDWSIKIVAGVNRGDPAVFVPDLQNATAGDPLVALPGDIVSWNNTTGETHQPVLLQADGSPVAADRGSPNYLSDPISAQSSSRPSWVVTALPEHTTSLELKYRCLLHDGEVGQIIVTTA